MRRRLIRPRTRTVFDQLNQKNINFSLGVNQYISDGRKRTLFPSLNWKQNWPVFRYDRLFCLINDSLLVRLFCYFNNIWHPPLLRCSSIVLNFLGTSPVIILRGVGFFCHFNETNFPLCLSRSELKVVFPLFGESINANSNYGHILLTLSTPTCSSVFLFRISAKLNFTRYNKYRSVRCCTSISIYFRCLWFKMTRGKNQENHVKSCSEFHTRLVTDSFPIQ